jgi:hypothetical protein
MVEAILRATCPDSADAADDDAAALAVQALLDQLQRREKPLVEPRHQRAHRVGLDGEHAAREFQCALAAAGRRLTQGTHCAYHSREV